MNIQDYKVVACQSYCICLQESEIEANCVAEADGARKEDVAAQCNVSSSFSARFIFGHM